ncbi:hypothetical protein GS597_19000 [Synechococcales cyanobacterium C]|uniref:Uncharacterized protein n=1 Tax=Petrachloros mirabilis ULC683 TaxID=2781853 RepID=A0A8K2A2F9_9CYAN|nr:hypothetical protein [Petrachloros mirabilis]NCJ08558.1 hypothetical protein [Petrachloros mirabilis ULC683]
MKVTLTKATGLALALSLGATSLLVAKPASANTASSFLGSFTGSLAGSLLHNALNGSRSYEPPIVVVPSNPVGYPTNPYSYDPYFLHILSQNGLVPSYCSPYAVNVVFGPGQVFCAQPTTYYVPGRYQIRPHTLQLVRVY